MRIVDQMTGTVACLFSLLAVQGAASDETIKTDGIAVYLGCDDPEAITACRGGANSLVIALDRDTETVRECREALAAKSVHPTPIHPQPLSSDWGPPPCPGSSGTTHLGALRAVTVTSDVCRTSEVIAWSRSSEVSSYPSQSVLRKWGAVRWNSPLASGGRPKRRWVSFLKATLKSNSI